MLLPLSYMEVSGKATLESVLLRAGLQRPKSEEEHARSGHYAAGCWFACWSPVKGALTNLSYPQVASLAARIVQKWKKVVLAEQPARKGHAHQTTQPG